MNKKLFCVKDQYGKVMVADNEQGIREPAYFDNKAVAKSFRRALNGTDEKGNEKLNTGFIVSYGPDHDRRSMS